MTLEELLNTLNELLEHNPNLKDKPVICRSDSGFFNLCNVHEFDGDDALDFIQSNDDFEERKEELAEYLTSTLITLE